MIQKICLFHLKLIILLDFSEWHLRLSVKHGGDKLKMVKKAMWVQTEMSLPSLTLFTWLHYKVCICFGRFFFLVQNSTKNSGYGCCGAIDVLMFVFEFCAQIITNCWFPCTQGLSKGATLSQKALLLSLMAIEVLSPC